MSQDPEPDAAFFELTAFLVSSARGAIEEGVFTASLRLLDAAGRLAALATAHVDDPFLARLGPKIAAHGPAAYLASAEQYLAYLDEVLREVAVEGARRAGVSDA
jgi:hypothetical protein